MSAERGTAPRETDEESAWEGALRAEDGDGGGQKRDAASRKDARRKGASRRKEAASRKDAQRKGAAARTTGPARRTVLGRRKDAVSRKDGRRKGAASRAGAARRRTLFARWGLVGWVVILAAAVFLGGSAWTVWRGGDGAADGPERGRAAVLQAAERHIATLNSMDRGNVDAGLRAWLDATTGALRAQLQRDEAANRRKIGESGTDAAAKVTAAAVTSLDERAGEAAVIASVQVELTLQGGEPTLQRKRFEAELVRTPQGWKLESLTSVPVGGGR